MPIVIKVSTGMGGLLSVSRFTASIAIFPPWLWPIISFLIAAVNQLDKVFGIITVGGDIAVFIGFFG